VPPLPRPGPSVPGHGSPRRLMEAVVPGVLAPPLRISLRRLPQALGEPPPSQCCRAAFRGGARRVRIVRQARSAADRGRSGRGVLITRRPGGRNWRRIASAAAPLLPPPATPPALRRQSRRRAGGVSRRGGRPADMSEAADEARPSPILPPQSCRASPNCESVAAEGWSEPPQRHPC